MQLIILLVIPLMLVLGLSMPLANLVFHPDNGSSIQVPENKSKAFKKVAPILKKKCADCHVPGAKLPFYANLPVAKQIIQADIGHALSDFRLRESLFSDKEPSEKLLAELEYIFNNDLMPPPQYKMMHWDMALSKKDRKQLLKWIRNERSKRFSSEGISEEFKGEVVQPLPKEVKLNDAKVKLGKRLFHDTRLSGDNTISCASCHDLGKGGTDQSKTSTGIGGAVGPINSPTVFNSSYNFKQFWDGRAANLKEQAHGPVNNPIEMGSDWKQAVNKIRVGYLYSQQFGKIYWSGINSTTIVDAIAEFEKSLITPNSRFDDYLRGDRHAITDEESKGYKLFKKYGCAVCHIGKSLGGQSFEKMGKAKDYFKMRGNITEVDNGRFNVTGEEYDRYKFKVPNLRNVALTYPYFHDGYAETLEDAVRIMAEYQRGVKLSKQEVDLIVKFLNTLTGEYEGELLK